MNIALALSRLATFGSVTVLVGALCFVAFVWPDGLRSKRLHTITRTALVAAGLSTIAAMIFYGPYAAGGGLNSMTMAVYSEVVTTKFQIASVVRIAVLACIAALVWMPRRSGFDQNFGLGITALLVALAFTMSLTGHASTSGAFALAVDIVHLMAAGIWLGGLVVLLAVVLPLRPTRELAAIIPAYSTMAFRCIVVIAVTGFTQAIVQTGSINLLSAGTYGQLIVAKIVLFGLILGMGAMSREWVRRRYVYKFEGFPEEDLPEPQLDAYFRSGLRKSVTAEVMIAVAILAVTAVLVMSSPVS